MEEELVKYKSEIPPGFTVYLVARRKLVGIEVSTLNPLSGKTLLTSI